MSLVVTVAVIALVYVYVLMNRQARLRWLQQIDLPGLWREQSTEQAEAQGAQLRELRLLGGMASGDYWLLHNGHERRGRWHFRGDELSLSDQQGEAQKLVLRVFRPGEISLQGPDGKARLFYKQIDNVVSLHKPTGEK